jgi:hypothetical protein
VNRRIVRSAILLSFLLITLTACNIQREGNPVFNGGQETPFLPPTLIIPTPVQPTNTSPAAVIVKPTTSSRCTDNLTYQTDLTIPDGTRTAPGTLLDKRWQVQNSGTCNWDENYRLKLVGGSSLGAPTDQALFPARSGMPATLRILFTAPLDPGSYRSAWQAYNPQGEPFGDPIFIEIVVEGSNPTP